MTTVLQDASGPVADNPRPRLVVGLALDPDLTHLIFSPDTRERLEKIADVRILDPGLLATDPGSSGVADVDVLLTGWGSPRIDAQVLAVAPRLSAVVHAAGSVRWLVAAEALERISVSSAGAVNAVPVAQYTTAMIHLAAKRAFFLAARYRHGQHLDYSRNPVSGSIGRTIGIVGASRIGRLVIKELTAGPNPVLVSDPYLSPDEARVLGVQHVELDELFDRSDIVSIHAPLLAQTEHMIDAALLRRLRDGAVVINTGRGRLIDTDALVAECRTGRIDAVLDVTDPEPLPAGHPLLELDNVFVTPHIAGSSGTELRLLGDFAVDEVERLTWGEDLHGRVRPEQFGARA